ncbi:hypothetical protein SAMN03159463_04072 [Mesorhizobium sp. NFR06]|uniref:hypothetical protein n=1 Tax=Mesorhizobium sp. NFR06 TaxID=1566290 RepID=UPI0008E2D88C|nr:hypothetical protein [Mesorhizobium sp. NFR06]SFP35656.1 hypothetical protein SAMN03159463_04072 [Mesorhizobium sp. NFR06]
MFQRFSQKLRDDAHCKVHEAMRANGIIDIVGLSEQIRLKNLDDNIAREDVESLVMQIAQLYGAPIEFDDQALAALDLPDLFGRDNRNDLEKALRERSVSDAPDDLLQLDG